MIKLTQIKSWNEHNINTLITATQNENNLYDIKNMEEIDFDESSRMWRMNKKKISFSQGQFEYVCGYPKKNGEPCRAPPKSFKKQFREDFKQTWSYCIQHCAMIQKNK